MSRGLFVVMVLSVSLGTGAQQPPIQRDLVEIRRHAAHLKNEARANPHHRVTKQRSEIGYWEYKAREADVVETAARFLPQECDLGPDLITVFATTEEAPLNTITYEEAQDMKQSSVAVVPSAMILVWVKTSDVNFIAAMEEYRDAYRRGKTPDGIALRLLSLRLARGCGYRLWAALHDERQQRPLSKRSRLEAEIFSLKVQQWVLGIFLEQSAIPEDEYMRQLFEIWNRQEDHEKQLDVLSPTSHTNVKWDFFLLCHPVEAGFAQWSTPPNSSFDGLARGTLRIPLIRECERFFAY